MSLISKAKKLFSKDDLKSFALVGLFALGFLSVLFLVIIIYIEYIAKGTIAGL